jgi:cytochrome b pre-mRNA-processing protein 3
VPDSVNGRFEMVVLHAILVLRRLDGEARPIRRLGQALFDMFCQDMDASLREMGVGDLGVPREMRRMGEAFFGRKAAYEAALAARDEGALVTALARNVFGAPAGFVPEAERLAGYVHAALAALARQDQAALERGELVFPDPEAVTVVQLTSEGAGK